MNSATLRSRKRRDPDPEHELGANAEKGTSSCPTLEGRRTHFTLGYSRKVVRCSKSPAPKLTVSETRALGDIRQVTNTLEC